MKINSTGADFIRSDQARELQRSAQEKSVRKPAAPTPAGVERSDKVEISDAARQLARGAQSSKASGAEFTPERVALIREKILSGAYNSLDVVDQVARKMLASGDI